RGSVLVALVPPDRRGPGPSLRWRRRARRARRWGREGGEPARGPAGCGVEPGRGARRTVPAAGLALHRPHVLVPEREPPAGESLVTAAGAALPGRGARVAPGRARPSARGVRGARVVAAGAAAAGAARVPAGERGDHRG